MADGGRPRVGARLGAIWGAVACVVTGWPFASMLATPLEVSVAYGWAAFLVGSLLLFVFPTAVVVAWLAWVRERRETVGPFVVAVGWASYEFLRTVTSLDIPWSLAATSQVPFSAVLQIADLGGAPVIGMLVAACNGAVAGLFAPEFAGRRPWAARLGVVALVGLAVLYGQWRLGEDRGDGRSVAIAVVQGGAAPRTPTPEAATDLLEHYLALTRRAPDAELVFWPEFAIDFLPVRFTDAQKRLVAGARDAGVDVVFGGPYEQIEIEGTRHFNAVYAIHQGRVRDWYEKEVPLLLSERELWGIRSLLGKRSYERGARSHPLQVRAGLVGVAVCSEVMNPGLVRRRVLDGAEILANPSNDAWMAVDSAMRQQLAIATLRAVENRRYLVRATTTGYSAVIDSRGEILVQGERDAPVVLEATIHPREEETVYQRVGAAPVWLSVLIAVLYSAVLRRSR